MRNMIIFFIGVLMSGQAMACGLCDEQEIRPSHAVQSASGSPIGLVALKGDAKPVRIAYLQNDIHHLALWVALDQGYLIEGKDVQIAGIFPRRS
jgi:hypothetical protein